ncbi:MAG TPA: ATPase [Erysipelotrichaceae bacterium]|nr:ATPase [Erysipelotrichaceae bacterium]
MILEKCVIGIEFGSTRIKAVMLDENHEIIASNEYVWESTLKNGIWIYTLEQARMGLIDCYAGLKNKFETKYRRPLSKVGAIGISGMMHGYLVFDKKGQQLAEFRTWKNTICPEAQDQLSKLFNFNIPQRWTVAHLYQAILNEEKEVKEIAFATTLAGYFHYLLTGQKVIGANDASGIFPLDNKTKDYDAEMIKKFDKLIKDKVNWKILDIIPKCLLAGENAGYLTKKGSLIIDPSGVLQSGIPFCPPEGDMGTGMIATNSVRIGYGNSSLGTSSNVTLVTDKKIKVNKEIDVIASPSGNPAVLIHANNCTTDINAWVELLHQAIVLAGGSIQKNELFVRLFNKSLEGEPDAGGLISFNYFTGEAAVGVQEGRPLFVREPDAKLSLANFMKVHILAILAIVRIGLDIVIEQGVKINKIYGHGGFFKTPVVGARALSAALNAPVATLASAGEGGPYGEALLAAYMLNKEKGESLEDFLANKVFINAVEEVAMATQEEVRGFNKFLERYIEAIPVEVAAIKHVKGQHI